jgi:hypothetical protein
MRDFDTFLLKFVDTYQFLLKSDNYNCHIISICVSMGESDWTGIS